MSKKQIYNSGLLLVLLLAVVFVSGCAKDGNVNTEPKISAEEQEFNDSGRAKAILDEEDLQSHYVQELQGRWISVYDEDSVIEFKDDKKIDYYAGQYMSEDVFSVYTTEFLIVGEGEDKLEYKIAELSEDTLILIYLARGNLLEYKRIKEE